MRRELLIFVFLTVITLAAFSQVLKHEFVNYDDQTYVVDNPHVREGLTAEGFIWAFTSVRASNWHPITWLSHMLDCSLYGLKPLGHHLTNVLLHLANSLLLYLLLRRMTGTIWQSVFVAALFAIHPMHVESVAWVAERKDVLSTLFWILTTWAYVLYVEGPGFKRYLLMLLAFALGLMAKPMLVTLPFVLLLLDYWPLGRFDVDSDIAKGKAQNQASISLKERRSLHFHLAWEKIPLFALATVSSVVTFFVQQSTGAVETLDVIPIKFRLANALVSYVSYIYKMLWPQRLAVFYPHPGSSVKMWLIAGAAFVLVCVSIIVIWEMRRRPYLAVGWLWYLGTLVPVIGIVQVGQQAMADRYSYIPLIGLFIVIAWGVPELFPRSWHYRGPILVVSATVIIGVLTSITWIQVKHWRNSVSLFQHALAVTDNNYLAHYNLGMALVTKGEVQKSIEHFSRTLEINPNHWRARLNLGNAYMHQRKLEKAIFHFSELLQKRPYSAEVHHNLGLALLLKGEDRAAAEHFSLVVRLNPDSAPAYNYLGLALARQGKLNEALDNLSAALRLRPDYREAYLNREKVLYLIQKQ